MQYISYIRVSTNKQEKSGLGLEAQKATVRNYIKGEPLAEYIENGEGWDELDNALFRAHKEKCGLIVANIELLPHDMGFVFGLKKYLKEQLYSCDSYAQNTLMLGVKIGLLHYEAEQRGERVFHKSKHIPESKF